MAKYYTAEEAVKKPFLFVSYKHTDKEIVVNVIDALLESGIRLWYDKDLCPGDEWNEIAEKMIKCPNCKGVIFFNSADSFKSGPVYEERCFALSRAEECKKRDEKFSIFPVNIGKPSTMRLLKSIFDSLPDNDAEIEREFTLEYLKSISETFKSNLIYCYADPEDTEGYIAKLTDAIAKSGSGVIDKSALALRELRDNGAQSSVEIGIGVCKGKSVTTLPDYMLRRDGIAKDKNTRYIIDGGKAYSVKNMTWRPLYCEDDVFVLLSESVIDVRTGGAELERWLTETFASYAFSPEERSIIRSIRLLGRSDMEKTENKDMFVFADSSASESTWWISDMVTGVLQMAVKKSGSTYDDGYNYRTKKCGVRPVITVHRNDITAFN